jgi:acrylyl-CoA reductase (NADPH)
VFSAILIEKSEAGQSVAAATGKPSEAGYLQQLGAVTVLDRAELAEPGKPVIAR